MFKKDHVYIIETTRRFYIAKFSGPNEVAEPFLNFHDVVALDEGKYKHFVKTGAIKSGDLKGAYSFTSGFWIQRRYIMQAIEVGVVPNE